MPKISIIVPVYKVEKYLGPCIDSILSQSFTDYELILVDDGSPDNCGAICDAYARKDERIRVIHQQNGGLSIARNNGVKAAVGEYICFVDGDDLLASVFCETMVTALCASNCDFAAGRILRFSDETIIPKICDTEPVVSVCSGIQYLGKQLSQGFSACGKLYRRYIFQTVSFTPGIMHEDIFFLSEVARTQRNGVCSVDTALYYYRQNEESIMAQSRKQCSPDRVNAGVYLYNTVRDIAPELGKKAFTYAVDYPWSFVDGIYVDGNFRKNRELLKNLQLFLRDNPQALEDSGFDHITKTRMRLFSKGMALYGINAYARLFRVYLYHILKKDPYKDGHGI